MTVMGSTSMDRRPRSVFGETSLRSGLTVDLSPELLLKFCREECWSLVLLDFDVDTSKPTGRLVAHVLAAVAEFERQRIRERTKEALAKGKAFGTRLGRPRQLPDDIVVRVELNRNAGRTLQDIADDLNNEGVPTSHGGSQWWPSTVAGVLRSAELDRVAASG